MSVYIANFGVQNYEWPECLKRGTIATVNEVKAFELWKAGDREGYIRTRMAGLTVAGKQPTKAVAARWYIGPARRCPGPRTPVRISTGS